MTSRSAPGYSLATLQLIVTSLIVGVVIFLAIAITIGPTGQGGSAVPLNLLRAIWGALLLGGLAAASQMPRISAAATRREVNDGGGNASQDDSIAAVFPRYLVTSIMVAALLEAPAILGAVLYLLGGEMLDLTLAVAPLVVMMATFPTRSRFERFIGMIRGRDESPSPGAPNEFRQYQDPIR